MSVMRCLRSSMSVSWCRSRSRVRSWGWTMSSKAASSRSSGVVAVSYRLLTVAPRLVLEINFCWGRNRFTCVR